MYRVGIIGSDNSHAELFAKLVNLPDEKTGDFSFPDIRVTCIFGLDAERTKQVANRGMIGTIAVTPEEMLDKVDAEMVVFRHGDLHLPYALPFIKEGIPTWIDKPFTIKNDDARLLLEEARRNGTLLTGGSTCKYIPDILDIQNTWKNGSSAGKIYTAVLNFPATLENEYGGICFYGAHLVEMAMAAFGHDVRSVVASEKSGLVTAVLKYDNIQLTLNFIPNSKEYYAVLYGENGITFKKIDIEGCYLKGFTQFAEMLRNRKLPLPFEHIYTPVAVLNAIKESYETGNEIYVERMDVNG